MQEQDFPLCREEGWEASVAYASFSLRTGLRPVTPKEALGEAGKQGWSGLSVSTHHRAQSLFPRLKPSQLKSSKPRVVGATPPPVEKETDAAVMGGQKGSL